MPSSNFKITTREQPAGAREISFPTRDHRIKSRDFQDVQAANPVHLFWGTVRTAGVTLTPVFDFKKHGSGGKSEKGGGSGTSYSGKCAVLIGFGPGDILHQIDNGDTPIFTGPIFRQDAIDGDGKSVLTTSICKMRFYWGTALQNVDSLLANIFIDQGNGGQIAPMPAYRNCMIAVLDTANFGAQQVPPTLYFTVSRFPSLLPLNFGVTRVNITAQGTGYTTNFDMIFTGGDGSGAAGTAVVSGGKVKKVIITNPGSGYTVSPTCDFSNGDGTGASGNAYALHEIIGDLVTLGTPKAGQNTPPYFQTGDAMIPEIIYDLFTNNLYGAGLDPANLITQDFIDAANVNIAEGLGASPFFNENNKVREMLGKLLVYPDSFLYQRKGQIGIKLIRPVDLGAAVSLSEDDFTDELKPENKGVTEAWSMTRVTFTDAANHFKTDSEPFDSPATADAIGYSVEKEASYPFVTQRDVAKQIARRVGVKASLPPFLFHARLLPKHATLEVGQVVKINYAKFGFVDQPARITNKKIGKPTQPEVEIDFIAEQARDMANDYTPPADFLFTPGIIDDDGTKNFTITSTDPRVLWLPTPLLNGKRDGWLTVFGRAKTIDETGLIYFTFDTAFKPFKLAYKKNGFAVKGDLECWHRFANDPTQWIIRLRFLDDLALSDFQNMLDAEATKKTQFGSDFGSDTDLYFVFAERKVRADGSVNEHQVTGFWAILNFDGYFNQVNANTIDIQIQTGQFTWPDFTLETVADPGRSPTQLCYCGPLANFSIFQTNGIAFMRDKKNNSHDTGFARRVRVALRNSKKTQSVDDAPEVDYFRENTSMCANGTFSPDWGPASPTTYELYDFLAGDIFRSEAAIQFNLVQDIDDSLLRNYFGDDDDTDKTVFGSIDQILGVRFQLNNGLDTDNP